MVETVEPVDIKRIRKTVTRIKTTTAKKTRSLRAWKIVGEDLCLFKDKYKKK